MSSLTGFYENSRYGKLDGLLDGIYWIYSCTWKHGWIIIWNINGTIVLNFTGVLIGSFSCLI